MEITIGQNAGFCSGVDFAIKQANKLLKEGEIYCLGEIVHNEQLIQDLEKKGMITVNDLEEIPDYESVIFRSHGEPISTYQKAEKKGLRVEDLTCRIVKALHKKVQKAKETSFILIIGLKNHPEIIGTLGFAGQNAYIIETEDDILDAYIEYEKTNLGKIYVVSQTTFSSQKFDDLAEEIQKNFCEAEVIIDKTICNSTENRQLETMKIAKNSDIMLIVGGEKSSNTRKLFEIANKYCKRVHYLQTVKDMEQIPFKPTDKVGIMAGASTPKLLIEEIKTELERKF